MSAARLVYDKKGDEAHVRFDNPAAHNALTSQMWHDLRDAARDIAADPNIRVATFRGVGGKAFISGTDISKFADYETGQQGVDYERDIDICMGAIDEIPCTTIAIVDGWAVGGGMNISSACDFRIATPNARFGSPIAFMVPASIHSASSQNRSTSPSECVTSRIVLPRRLNSANLSRHL